MEVVEFKIKGRHSLELACLKVMPKKEPKAVVQIFHGMGEHKERYLNFAKWMAKQDYAVFVHDHRKHGESISEFDSVGIFTDSDRWEYVIDDAHYVVKHARKEVKDVPIIILGHSMGSVIARRYISKYTALPSAAIIMGTLPIQTKGSVRMPLMIANIIKLFKKNKPSAFLANMLNSRLVKHMKDRRTDFDWLSNDEKQVDKYIADPLCGYPYSAKFYIEFFKGVAFINDSTTISETRNIPILFIAGKDDPVGEFGSGVKDVYELYNGHGFFQLTYKLIENNRHEILNELKKTTTYKYVKEWCDSTLENQ